MVSAVNADRLVSHRKAKTGLRFFLDIVNALSFLLQRGRLDFVKYFVENEVVASVNVDRTLLFALYERIPATSNNNISGHRTTVKKSMNKKNLDTNTNHKTQQFYDRLRGKMKGKYKLRYKLITTVSKMLYVIVTIN